MSMVKYKEKNLRLKDGKWYIDFTFKHKRIRKFAGWTKEQAKNTLAKLRLELLNEDLGFKKPGAENIPFEKFTQEWLEIYARPNKKSWRRDELSLKSLIPWFKGKNLSDIKPDLVEAYKAKRKLEVSPATVNRELACLKTIMNKAVEWGKLEVNPIAKVKKFREQTVKERILTNEEITRLLEAAAPHLRPILIVLLNTGMRRGEVLNLKWSDVDFKTGYIFIGDSKSGKSRRVPMSGLVYETLERLKENKRSEFVFSNSATGEHIKDIKTGFHAACRRAGIKGVRIHDLRHTAASKMVEAGVDLVTVSKILGHSSIQMTMRYAHPTAEAMRRAVESLADLLEKRRQKDDSLPKESSISYSKISN
jgi:integrase